MARPLSEGKTKTSEAKKAGMRKRYARRRTEIAETRRSADVATILVYQAKARAKAKGIPCTIEPSDVEVPEFCPVLGIRLRFNLGKPQADSYSLDRVRPALGYVPGNIRVMSMRANTIKGAASIEELEAVLAYMRLCLDEEADE